MINIITSPKNIDDIIKLKEAGANTIICGMPFFSVRAVSHFTNEEIKTSLAKCEILFNGNFYYVALFSIEYSS